MFNNVGRGREMNRLVVASYPGLPMSFNVSCETLKNMGMPGYEARLVYL